MEIIKVAVGEIKPYENNVKKHPKKQIQQIKDSIVAFGNNDPIAIDENSVIIEGHGRFMALKELNYTEVECIRLIGLSEEQKKAYRLVHNKLNLNTEFEEKDLLEELDLILTTDMTKFGFEDRDEEVEGDVEGEEPFTEVLGEEHNYLVLYFDNDVDWLQAQSLFDLKPVKAFSTRKDGELGEAGKRVGVGRVVKGSVALAKVLKNENIG
jgi:hypothetical protein